jgi:uncharacterized protein
MKLPPLPISSKKAAIAIGVLVFIAVNYEELWFFALESDLATPSAMEGVVAQPSAAQPQPIARSAFERLKDSAQLGNVKDQLTLAVKYSTADGVPKDQAEASQWYLMAAQGGDVHAMYEVSMRYTHGYGFTKNNAEADVWRQRAASEGHPKAAWEFAHMYGTVTRKGAVISQHKNNDPGDSSRQLVMWLTRASELGSAEAKHELALVRLFGISKGGADRTSYLVPLPSVTASAMQLLTENAEAGYWESQYALAELYQTGYADIKPSQTKSNEWWQQLDAQTDASVQVSIGRRYLASDVNEYRAGDNKWKGKSLSYSETNQVAIDWFGRAAIQANKDALWHLVLMEYSGIGTPKNPARALQLQQKAAELGHVEAMYYLGLAHATGDGVQKDYPRALHWLGRSVAYEDAYGGNILRSSAQNVIGSLYENGDGVGNDLMLAYVWYNLAATGGFIDASTNVSRVAQLLKPEQLREAENLARDWKPGNRITPRTP